jgi:aspartate/methionine/tyrosine aminotransferase
MPIAATSKPILPAGTPSPLQLASPAALRRMDRDFELLARDLENIMQRFNALIQFLQKNGVTITITGQSTFTMNLTGITGASVIHVADGEVTGFTP